MNPVFEKKENNTVFFNFELDNDKFEKAINEVYLQNRGRFNIPGFRRGKTPRKIIELNYGKEIFYEEAINKLLPEAYDEAVNELELEPVATPEVDIEEIEKGKPIVVNIEVDVKPEVKLGDYKNIELEKIEYKVTDEMVEEKILEVQDSNARLLDAGDEEIKDGDIANIDFTGSIDGEEFPGGSGEGHDLTIGSNTFIPGFEEQLIGKKKDDEVEVKTSFPEDYHEESLAGKEALFKVKINSVQTKELPELDDEFVKDVSEFDTLDEYKKDIREKLEEEYKNREVAEKENAVLEKVVELSEVDIPEGMIETQLDNEIRQFDFRLRNQGLELEQYLQMTGSDIEDLKEQLEPVASNRVNVDLVLEAIVEEENIEVSEEDIDKELEKMADQYQAEDKEEFIENMKSGDLESIKAGIANTKAVEFLLENATFKE